MPMKPKGSLVPDPAAVVGCIISLNAAARAEAEARGINLSDAYGGDDEFMRAVYKLAHDFEAHACRAVDFDALNGWWPYLLEEHFGMAVMKALRPNELYNVSDGIIGTILEFVLEADRGASKATDNQ